MFRQGMKNHAVRSPCSGPSPPEGTPCRQPLPSYVPVPSKKLKRARRGTTVRGMGVANFEYDTFIDKVLVFQVLWLVLAAWHGMATASIDSSPRRPTAFFFFFFFFDFFSPSHHPPMSNVQSPSPAVQLSYKASIKLYKYLPRGEACSRSPTPRTAPSTTRQRRARCHAHVVVCPHRHRVCASV